MSLLKKVKLEELFGNEAGEEESPDFLREVYIESEAYKEAIDKTRIICVRSRKGVGKSALLARAHAEIITMGVPCLWISPTDLAMETEGLEYNSIVRHLKQKMARLCVGKIAEEIGVLSSGGYQDALTWAEKDGFRSKDFIGRLAKTFQGVVKANTERNVDEEAVNRLLARLTTENRMIVFIDDFDRGWSPLPLVSVRIRALISAIREISRECRGIDFRLALREDVWQHLELSDEQIDKFRQYTRFLNWNDRTLLSILTKRIEVRARKVLANWEEACSNDINTLSLLFERSYRWMDETKQMHEVLTKLARRRPRDIIQLAKGAAQRARRQGHKIISERDVRDEYNDSFSKVRTMDLIKEFQNECPEMNSLVAAFGGPTSSWVMTFEHTMKRIRSVNGHKTIQVFGRRADDTACLAFLYRCGFVSARDLTSSAGYRHLEYEDNPALVEAGVGVEKFDWEIHPAFRPYLRTLQPSEYHKATAKRRKGKN